MNHIHLLIALPPTVTLCKVMQDLKRNSSHWLNKRGVKFAWQEGFGVFGVSQSKKQDLVAYITRRDKHHGKSSFEQEYMTLLRRAGAQIDMPRCLGETYMTSLLPPQRAPELGSRGDGSPVLKHWALIVGLPGLQVSHVTGHA